MDAELSDTLCKPGQESILDMSEEQFDKFLKDIIEKNLFRDRIVLKWSGEGTWEFAKFENLVYHDIFILFDDYPYYTDYRPLLLALGNSLHIDNGEISDNMKIYTEFLEDDFIDLPF